MECLDDCITLRNFKDHPDTLFELFEAAIKKQIKFCIQSNKADHFIRLGTHHIQIIKSYHPEKVNISFEIIFERPSTPIEEITPFQIHTQSINFTDLWADKNAIDEIIKKPSLPLPAIQTAAVTNEKSTLLKLILGMAIANFQYNPLSARNSATGSNKGSIKYELEKIGLKIDEDTIRKYLEEAKEMYKKELKKDGRKIFLD